ncbi:hypothetical protein SDC9_192124 [bioreactor metagenome]|uniref:Uncharacterized protein n=1 Tax=bioreactor metagenome TaxID=1076179 RepID=A0A645I2B8_9ZZZZ
MRDESGGVVQRFHAGNTLLLIVIVYGNLDLCIFEVFCHVDIRQRRHRRNSGILHLANNLADRLFYLFVPSIRTKRSHISSSARTKPDGRHLRLRLCALDLFHDKRLNDVAFLKVVESVDANAAFVAREDFLRVILKALE